MTIHAAPVIATSRFYEAFLAAARLNLSNGLKLAQGLRDAEVEGEFQAIIDAFADASDDLDVLIADANEAAERDASGALADYRYETRRDAQECGL